MLILYIINFVIQLIITKQLASFSTKIFIKKQTIKVKNYNIITNNLKETKRIINNNNHNCAN